MSFALAALLYWDFFHGVGLTLCRVVLTIHNVGNSGEISQQEFSVTGVPGNLFATIDKALDERTVSGNARVESGQMMNMRRAMGAFLLG